MAAFYMSEELVGILRQEGAASELQTQVAQLFEESREDVYRYLMTLGLTPVRAQDATQEVFLRLYAALKSGEEIENPRGWIFRVAHNWGLKVRARHAAENPFDADLEAKLAAPAHDAEHDLLERERMLLFHRAVEASVGAAETVPVPAHGRAAVSGDRGGDGHQRFGRLRIPAARDGAAEEGAG